MTGRALGDYRKKMPPLGEPVFTDEERRRYYHPANGDPPIFLDPVVSPMGETKPAANRATDNWPELGQDALHGIAGDFVTSCDSYTEADSVAVLLSYLAAAGATINRGPHVLAGNAHHPASLFVVLVGQTAKGGKGTSWSVTRSLLEVADPDFSNSRIMGGFGSGEAVVDAIADKGDDNGSRDSRLLLVEPEFARILRVAARDGSTLSMTIRDGWDGYPLQVRSRSGVVVAKDYHLAAVCHVTLEELRLRLTDSETYGGFSNRFLFSLVRRTKRLPDGGNVPGEVMADHGHTLAKVLTKARGYGRLQRTPEAETLWADLYGKLADDEPGGLLGAVIGRDAPQVLRLALLYALLDASHVVDVVHLKAAWAVWTYSRDSAAYIFGDAQADPRVSRLLRAITAAGTNGLDLTEQQAAMGRNMKAAELEVIRNTLERNGVITTSAVTNDETGRTRRVSRVCAGDS